MRLPHYQATRVRLNRQSFYEIEGHRYPGVTTILSATKPREAREALQQWRQRVGAEAAQQISGRASSAGTRLHKRIAAHLNGADYEIPADLEGYWRSLEPVLAEIEDVLLVEGAVWHSTGFAGFPDALVVYQGALTLIDWKTAQKPKRAEWIEDYFLQTAAYCAAINRVYGELGIAVEQAMVAISLDNQPAQLFKLPSEALTHHWQGFQKRLREYRAYRQY